MIRRTALVPAMLMCVATVALPCGGSEVYNVDGPLFSAATFAERAISPVLDLESYTRAEVRLLPGLLRADTVRFAALMGRSPLQPFWWDTLTKPRIAEPTTVAIDAAWARGDAKAATNAAQQVVDRVMALPAADDSARDAALRLAVETIELAPAVASEPVIMRAPAFAKLAAPLRAVPVDSMPAVLAREPTSLRRASLEYAALRLAMRSRIPDDTREEITKQVPAALWDSLHLTHRAWLTKYPAHPYAGLVKFARLRLFFLSSQRDSAWSTAIALYKDYPARAGAEMRYLLLVGFAAPDRLLTDGTVPGELRAALVGNLRPSADAWQSLLHLATANRAAPWAEGLEERLMATLASDSAAARALPQGFPAWRESASPFWRYMWAVNMVRANRLDDAVKFARRPVTQQSDSLLYVDAAMLSARIHMLRGDWRAAMEVPNVDLWTRRYMLRVLAPESVAASLLSSRDAAVVSEARLVLATRAAGSGKWDEAAAMVRPSDAPRATRYARIAALARDTATNAGLQRFAQALGSYNGQVFYEATRYFYRGMMYRDYALAPGQEAEPWDLPWSRSDERRRMYAYLRGGSERLMALKAYASYFGRPGVTAAQRRVAVRDADRAYRGLLDTDPSRSGEGFWGDSLPKSTEAQAIRRAGRR